MCFSVINSFNKEIAVIIIIIIIIIMSIVHVVLKEEVLSSLSTP